MAALIELSRRKPYYCQHLQGKLQCINRANLMSHYPISSWASKQTQTASRTPQFKPDQHRFYWDVSLQSFMIWLCIWEVTWWELLERCTPDFKCGINGFQDRGMDVAIIDFSGFQRHHVVSVPHPDFEISLSSNKWDCCWYQPLPHSNFIPELFCSIAKLEVGFPTFGRL